jgi:hypothetical protein
LAGKRGGRRGIRRDAVGKMRDACERILREKEMPVCILCLEYHHRFEMSETNPRICKDCYAIYDQSRFIVTEIKPPTKEEKDDDRRAE